MSASGSFPSNPSNSIIVRLKIANKIGMLAKITNIISEIGGNLDAIDIVRPTSDALVRDISIFTHSEDHGLKIVEALKQLENVEFIRFYDRTFLVHEGGKLSVESRLPLKSRNDLSLAYTPGVARVCMALYRNPEDTYRYTIKGNCVAVVTDGTAVLGLGNIGPKAAMPVMEGKAMLFKEFAGIDAWPICLDTQDTEEIIRIVKAMAPGLGGVNLEDIAAPRCFEIEKRLQEELDIPVFHDDQHGTAVVTTAALINALKLVGKKAESLKVVVSGAGAAGTACTKMMMLMGITNIVCCDSKGALNNRRTNLSADKQWLVDHTNPGGEAGSLKDVIRETDVFVGVSQPNLIDEKDLQNMAKDPIVFAMANPDPEIMPEIAQPYVAVMATGRSDYPNQINNVLCFPGIFRGAINSRSSIINEEMKMAAAEAIAHSIDDKHLAPDYIIPSVFDQTVVPAVSEAVQKAAVDTGVARREKIVRMAPNSSKQDRE
jgi:malate dehydrogenase (oxaloacetate-decarboxylating)